MFNAPRTSPSAQRYNASNSILGGYVDDNPLASSVFDDGGLDPWSGIASTPALSARAPLPSLDLGGGGGGEFANIIAGATVPAIYSKALASVDPTSTGETSVSALIRVLSTSGLPASTIDRIINLVSSRPRVSKLEFFVALALVALAQAGKDISIEQVASHGQQNTLPSPTLDLAAIQAGTLNSASTAAVRLPTSPSPAYVETDPWKVSSPFSPPAINGNDVLRNGIGGGPGPGQSGAPTTISGGLGKDWWKRQESISISILPEKQGFLLTRFTVYLVESDRGPPVPRRYSEFVYLWECLVRRYPFRILPQLPPKRIGGDDTFLEQRRKGLVRFLTFIVNHPVLKEDGLLAVFLTEPSFEAWRKHASISLEEESASKRIDRVEEMGIPSDLEEKMTVVRNRVFLLIEQWTKLCIIAERIIKRREAEAADLSRLTTTLNVMIEENEYCWHAVGCELYSGVRQGTRQTSLRLQNHAESLEHRTRVALLTSLEALKSQRDLYLAVRDLFARHDRLSLDAVDRLKKRVDINSRKLEAVKAARKDGWDAEADRILGIIEKDQADIASAMARRIFIRHSMWHELRVVLHNRENTLLSLAVQTFSKQERDFTEGVFGNWAGLADEVESMPLE